MTSLTYTPAVLSGLSLLSYVIGAAAFAGLINLPHIVMLPVFPALFWFMVSWAVGLAQLAYGAIWRRKHPALSGFATLACTGGFVIALQGGLVITV